MMLARGPADVLDRLFGTRCLRPGFLSHLRFLTMSYDEPKILSSQLNQFGLEGVDPGQVYDRVIRDVEQDLSGCLAFLAIRRARFVHFPNDLQGCR